jgi:hypothetical protein
MRSMKLPVANDDHGARPGIKTQTVEFRMGWN